MYPRVQGLQFRVNSHFYSMQNTLMTPCDAPKPVLCEFQRCHQNSHGKVVSELRFIDAPLGSACRITLPTDVVESSVKIYFPKLRWIVLNSSAFFFLPTFFLFLHLRVCVFSLIWVLWVLGFHVGWTICAFNLIGSIFGGSRQKHIIIDGTTTSCWWCRRSARSNYCC